MKHWSGPLEKKSSLVFGLGPRVGSGRSVRVARVGRVARSKKRLSLHCTTRGGEKRGGRMSGPFVIRFTISVTGRGRGAAWVGCSGTGGTGISYGRRVVPGCADVPGWPDREWPCADGPPSGDLDAFVFGR